MQYFQASILEFQEVYTSCTHLLLRLRSTTTEVHLWCETESTIRRACSCEVSPWDPDRFRRQIKITIINLDNLHPSWCDTPKSTKPEIQIVDHYWSIPVYGRMSNRQDLISKCVLFAKSKKYKYYNDDKKVNSQDGTMSVFTIKDNVFHAHIMYCTSVLMLLL